MASFTFVRLGNCGVQTAPVLKFSLWQFSRYSPPPGAVSGRSGAGSAPFWFSGQPCVGAFFFFGHFVVAKQSNFIRQSFFITLHLEQSFSPLFISNKNIWPLRLLFPLAFPLPPLLRPLPTSAGARFTSLDTPAFRLPTNRHGQTGQPARTHDR